MSRSMHWRPVPPPPQDGQLDTDLMFALERRFYHGHWEHNSGWEISTKDHTTISFLEGLAAGGVEDASTLLAKIEEHGTVVVWAGDGSGPR